MDWLRLKSIKWTLTELKLSALLFDTKLGLVDNLLYILNIYKRLSKSPNFVSMYKRYFVILTVKVHFQKKRNCILG